MDKTSVMNTIATVQNNLEYLAGQVRTAASGATNAYLAAPAAGRVKAIYANAGDDVQSVIREHGALMVVSLDGRMAVDAETASDAATPGQERHRPLRGRHGICGPHRDPPRRYPHRNAHG